MSTQIIIELLLLAVPTVLAAAATSTHPTLPVITEQPAHLRVHRGSPATLNCGAYGHPAPTISWYKEGRRVSTGAGDHTVLLPGGSLFFLRTLENHRSRDSGNYTCRAENEAGVVYSQTATLTVTYLKHEFGHVPKLVTAERGENIALACFPPEGNPKPTISWLKDGAILAYTTTPTATPGSAAAAAAKYSLDPSGVLQVRGLTAGDSGQYECHVTNEEGTRRDSPITLDITEPSTTEPIVVKNNNNNNNNRQGTDNDDIDEIMLATPVITESVLLDRITGLVAWRPVRGAAAYMVHVTVGTVDVTNITVEPEVDQIKLHSLDPDLVYSVRVAAGVVVGDDSSNNNNNINAKDDDDDALVKAVWWSSFSSRRELRASGRVKEYTVVRITEELDDVTNWQEAEEEDDDYQTELEDSSSDEISANVWVVGMIIILTFTLILILAAVVIFHRVAALQSSGSSSAAAANRDYEKGGGSSSVYVSHHGHCINTSDSSLNNNKRYSWIDRRWTGADCSSQPITSFKSDRLLLDNQYDYVMIPAGSTASDTYHYASSPIVKTTDCLLPVVLARPATSQ